MNAVVILLVGIAILALGYVSYGKWLANKWGVDPKATDAGTRTGRRK